MENNFDYNNKEFIVNSITHTYKEWLDILDISYNTFYCYKTRHNLTVQECLEHYYVNPKHKYQKNDNLSKYLSYGITFGNKTKSVKDWINNSSSVVTMENFKRLRDKSIIINEKTYTLDDIFTSTFAIKCLLFSEGSNRIFCNHIQNAITMSQIKDTLISELNVNVSDDDINLVNYFANGVTSAVFRHRITRYGFSYIDAITRPKRVDNGIVINGTHKSTVEWCKFYNIPISTYWRRRYAYKDLAPIDLLTGNTTHSVNYGGFGKYNNISVTIGDITKTSLE